MGQLDKTINLNTLYNTIKKNYIFYQCNGYENNPLFETEKILYEQLDVKDLGIIVSMADDIKINSYDQLLFDLTNVNGKSYQAWERLIYNLRNCLYLKSESQTDNIFSKELHTSLKTLYFTISLVENSIRSIFLDLLNKHINASTNMSESYLKIFKELNKNLKFKYHTIFSTNYELMKKHITTHLKSYEYEEIVNNYLDSLVEQTINSILAISDDMYESDAIYAQGVLYQILLRSLFIIINDYNRLATYESLYNNLENNKTIGKSIIKTAFISNYNDLIDYSKRKVKE